RYVGGSAGAPSRWFGSVRRGKRAWHRDTLRGARPLHPKPPSRTCVTCSRRVFSAAQRAHGVAFAGWGREMGVSRLPFSSNLPVFPVFLFFSLPRHIPWLSQRVEGSDLLENRLKRGAQCSSRTRRGPA